MYSLRHGGQEAKARVPWQNVHRKKGAQTHPHTETQAESLETTLESFHCDCVLLSQTKNTGEHNGPRSHCLFLSCHELPVIARKGNGSSDVSWDHRKLRSQVDRAFSLH